MQIHEIGRCKFGPGDFAEKMVIESRFLEIFSDMPGRIVITCLCRLGSGNDQPIASGTFLQLIPEVQ